MAEYYEWDDVGTAAESMDFDALPEGEYDFEVRNVRPERYEKKRSDAKVPNNCPTANVQLYCRNANASGTAFDRLYLYDGGMGRITDFLKCVGLISPEHEVGAPLPASFKQLFEQSIGATGRVKITVRTYKVDGQERKANNVRYVVPKPGEARQTYAPPAAPQPTQTWQQPQPTTTPQGYATPQPTTYQQPQAAPTQQPQQGQWGW